VFYVVFNKEADRTLWLSHLGL